MRSELDSTTIGNDVSQADMDRLAKLIVTAGLNKDSQTVKSWMKSFALYSSGERDKFLEILEQYRRSGYSTSLDDIWQLDFDRKPVPFDVWLEDPYFMGKLGEELYPLWQEELKYILHPNSPVVQWALTGAIGIGKTYVALIATIYKGAYFCSCLKSPQKYFGLASDSEIVFGLFNTIMDNAIQVNFNQLARFIKSSRYFQEFAPSVIRYSKGQIYWPGKEMTLKIGSSELHVLGSNMFSYIMDEANFMKVTAENVDNQEEQQAYKIYNNASRRMKSRFQKYGINPGLAIIASSRLTQSSFLEDLMEKNEGNPEFHVSDYALWDTKGRDIYSPHTFRVQIGNERENSAVLDEVDTTDTDKMEWTAIPEKAKTPTPGMQYVDVPTDFYHEFLADVDGSLRDVAGIPTFGKSQLIWRVESILECRQTEREHPFLHEAHELPLMDNNADLGRCVKWDKITRIVEGVREPIFHPGAPRFIHVDLGLTKDSTGIAMVCPYDLATHTQYDPLSGQITETFSPKVFVDFALQIKPTKGDQIDIIKVTQFILNMRNFGFHLQRVTFDGFASETAIQFIKKEGGIIPSDVTKGSRGFNDKLRIETCILSVDRYDVQYRVFRDLLNQTSLDLYPHPRLEKELRALEHDPTANNGRGKVNHPPKGSKDVADALCGAAYNVVTAKTFNFHDPIKNVMDVGKPDVEDVMMKAITGDYEDVDRVTKLLPPAQKPANSPKLNTNKQDWMRELEGFGRHS